MEGENDVPRPARVLEATIPRMKVAGHPRRIQLLHQAEDANADAVAILPRRLDLVEENPLHSTIHAFHRPDYSLFSNDTLYVLSLSCCASIAAVTFRPPFTGSFFCDLFFNLLSCRSGRVSNPFRRHIVLPLVTSPPELDLDLRQYRQIISVAALLQH